MPLNRHKQPQIIDLGNGIRLAAYDGRHEEALLWYTNPFVYYNSEGITDGPIPDPAYIDRMYSYLDQNSELYFIEVLSAGTYVRVGDVAIKPKNLPIVIGNDDFRGKGISKVVMNYAFKRLKDLGYHTVNESIVYKHNQTSKQMHESLGYVLIREDEKSYYFEKKL